MDNRGDPRESPTPPSAPPASPPRPRCMSTALSHTIGARSSRARTDMTPRRRAPAVAAHSGHSPSLRSYDNRQQHLRDGRARRDRLSNQSCGFEAADRFRVITMNRAERAGRRNRRNRARRRPTSQPPPRKKGTISTVSGTQGSAPGSRRSFSMSLARATVNLSAARALSLRGGDLRVPRRAVPVKSRRAVANTVSEMNKVRLRAPPRAIARRRRRDEVNPYLDAVP